MAAWAGCPLIWLSFFYYFTLCTLFHVNGLLISTVSSWRSRLFTAPFTSLYKDIKIRFYNISCSLQEQNGKNEKYARSRCNNGSIRRKNACKLLLFYFWFETSRVKFKNAEYVRTCRNLPIFFLFAAGENIQNAVPYYSRSFWVPHFVGRLHVCTRLRTRHHRVRARH